jgi:hypothetical protein
MNLFKIIITTIIFFVTPMLLIASGGKTADDRIRIHFGISTSIPLNQSTIREAFLHKIPLGTPEPVIQQRLRELGIGKDILSHYYGPDKNHKATIRIEFDPTTFEITKRHYGIHLTYDNEMKLNDILVDIWYTGP